MDRDLVYKALVCVAVESTLLDMGKPVYDRLLHDLDKNYNCYLSDCYDHPEYLGKTLKDLFCDSKGIVVESIKRQLGEFSYKKPIEKFLEVITN